MAFVEVPNFTKRITGLLDDEDYRRPQAALIANPELGDLITRNGRPAQSALVSKGPR
jgi:hypothetical protein